jgi:adenosylhomocysteinase
LAGYGRCDPFLILRVDAFFGLQRPRTIHVSTDLTAGAERPNPDASAYCLKVDNRRARPGDSAAGEVTAELENLNEPRLRRVCPEEKALVCHRQDRLPRSYAPGWNLAFVVEAPASSGTGRKRLAAERTQRCAVCLYALSNNSPNPLLERETCALRSGFPTPEFCFARVQGDRHCVTRTVTELSPRREGSEEVAACVCTRRLTKDAGVRRLVRPFKRKPSARASAAGAKKESHKVDREGRTGGPSETLRLPVEGTPDELVATLNNAIERAQAGGWTVTPDAEETARTLICQHGAKVSLEATGATPESALLGRARDMVRCSCSAALLSDVQGTPFTATEMANTRKRMPLTTSAPEWLATATTARPLEGLGAIFTIHHQRDFLVMLESAIALGLDPRHVLVIDKEYDYLHRYRVDGHIRLTLGAKTALYTDLRMAIEEFLAGLRARWQRALLVDDGGYLIPEILEGLPPPERHFVVGAVEQTSSGIIAVEPFLPYLEIPIFDVAESDLKETVEARGVAAAGWRSLRNELQDVHWNGRRALVCGYGRVGRALAEELRRESLQVAIHDSNYAKLVSALEDGFATYDSVGEAAADWHPDIVFGATGRAHWGADLFGELQRDTVLVSLTSRDYEFDKTYLAEHALQSEVVAPIGTRYILPTRSESRSVLLVADGFPVNFHRAESMPNEQSDLILAAMLLGAVEVVQRRPEFSPGVNKDRSNQIINQHGILKRYYSARKEQLQF